MSKVSNFVSEVVARLQGDDAAKIAAMNERKAASAFKQQISSLESQLVDDEVNVSEALEAYNDALYPIKKITDNKQYLENIVYKKELLDRAQATLEATQDSIEFFVGENKKVFTSKA